MKPTLLRRMVAGFTGTLLTWVETETTAKLGMT
jgi:hypothetical protein